MPPDPASALALKIGEKVGVAAVKTFVAKLTTVNDESFDRARRDVFEDWTIEAAVRSGEQFEHLRGRIENLEARLEERAADPTALRLHANFARAADAEPTPDRQRMLAYADAALVDVSLSVAQLSRVERLLRELDPADVRKLYEIDAVAGTFYMSQQQHAESHVRWLVWHQAEADVLVAAGCLRLRRMTIHVRDAGPKELDTIETTREGRLVLRVMRPYLRASSPEIVPPGHEARQGDCSEAEAWRVIHGVRDLRADVIRLSSIAPPPRYDFPKRDYRDGRQPPHNAKGTLRLGGISPVEAPAIAARAPAVPPGGQFPTDAIAITVDGGDHPLSRTLCIHGPHDVLRWLADEVDARWT